MANEKHFNDIAVKIVDEAETYAKLVAEPFERGYATTIGNSLRRILMTSVPGAAVTSLKIDGVQHEFSSIKGVVEDVSQIIQNLKLDRVFLLLSFCVYIVFSVMLACVIDQTTVLIVWSSAALYTVLILVSQAYHSDVYLNIYQLMRR